MEARRFADLRHLPVSCAFVPRAKKRASASTRAFVS
jgi:hypothetical protein